jgi:hypothetical protein
VDLRRWVSGQPCTTTGDDMHDEEPGSDQSAEVNRHTPSCFTDERRRIQDALHSGLETPSETTSSNNQRRAKRRKKSLGKVRPATHRVVHNISNITPPESPCEESQRQLRSSSDIVPQRKKPSQGEKPCFRPSTVDKLIIGIWENIHSAVRVMLPSAVCSPI